MSAAGFTGTRNGLTPRQQASLHLLLRHARPAALHHGDCQGADFQAHQAAGRLRIPRTIHPPSDGKLRAYCETVPADGMTRSPLPYLTRNKRIVNETRWLIAAPEEQPLDTNRTGGTWHTVRYAQDQGRMTVIIWPDGTIEIDGWRDAR